MTPAIPVSPDDFLSFLELLPGDLDVEALARETQAFRRPHGVRSGTDLLRLALIWACGGYSMQAIAA